MMDNSVTFVNAYNDVLMENLLAILKQNLLFQAQLKVTSEQLNKTADLEKQVEMLQTQLTKQNQQENRIEQLTNELNAKSEELRRGIQANVDQHRIQSALNEKTQEVTSLRAQIAQLTDELDQKSKMFTPNPLIDASKKKQKTKTALNITNDSVIPLKVSSSGGIF